MTTPTYKPEFYPFMLVVLSIIASTILTITGHVVPAWATDIIFAGLGGGFVAINPTGASKSTTTTTTTPTASNSGKTFS